jgi:hypothetical protein
MMMMMMMTTIILSSYSEFREVYGQIIRGDNACELNAELCFSNFGFCGGWGGGLEAVSTEVFTTFSSAFRKKNTLLYICVFSFPTLSNASRIIYLLIIRL